MVLRLIRLKNVHCCYKHTQGGKTRKPSYSHTIILPQTKFPLKLEGQKLIERDKSINELPAITELYKWQRSNLQGPEFILHDGPPYANGVPHIGHTINKILKDTIVRSNIIQGHRVHFIPGWDCHGLPIELKAITETGSKLTPLEIRNRARNFANEAISKQKEAFKSWGVIGDWENCYTTFSKPFMKNQIRKFFELFNKELVYRDVKPVYWSPSSQTALAEAELEYNHQHISKSVVLKLKLHSVPDAIKNNSSMFALIWTTTPWSLPSNQAVCFNPELTYSIIQKTEEELFIVATNLVDSVSKKLNVPLNIISTFSGKLLHEVTYHHPFNNSMILPFLPGAHASDNKGTGLVHLAPAHGPEDFLIALKNKLSIVNLVGEDGCFNTEAESDLKGLFVLTEGTEVVLKKLAQNVVHTENYVHSYPYDWRTKQPIIIRASKQWFIDTEKIKTKATDLLNNVDILPKVHSKMYRNYLVSNLQKRPYWCISRQRCWGVPIPVFYDSSTGNHIITRDIIEHLCELIDTHGSDYWWNLSKDQLLPRHILKDLNISANELQKGNDIFDIWFDSGLSWSSVLGDKNVADIYLEGVDQFTGWFQSSLITSAALRDKSPYKCIYVHGFAVDSKGQKMSKSLGNVVDPLDILQGKNGHTAFGIDALRWWVVCHANSDSVAHIGTNVLQASSDEVQKIRSAMRFALGVLCDYKVQLPDSSSLLLIDKYLLHLISNYEHQVSEFYKDYEFNKISKHLMNFLTNPVSSLYYSAIKDRLYCNAFDSSERRSAQFVLLQLLTSVVRSIAPIVPHLAEELYHYFPEKQHTSVFQDDFRLKKSWSNHHVAQLMENSILNIKSEIHKLRGSNVLNTRVHLGLSQNLMKHFEAVESNISALNLELVDIFQVSEVFIKEDDSLEGSKYILRIEESQLHKCERCRRVFASIENELCERCKVVTNNVINKKVVSN